MAAHFKDKWSCNQASLNGRRSRANRAIAQLSGG
jgi:hypothetical protein